MKPILTETEFEDSEDEMELWTGSLGDRLAIWRMRWFPYRTYEFLGQGEGFGPAKWQWPDVLRRRHRG